MINLFKKAMKDPIFMLSFFICLLELFIVGYKLDLIPPPLPYKDYGALIMPAEEHYLSPDTIIKGKKPLNEKSVVYYKIPLRHAETLSLVALQRNISLSTLISINNITDLSTLKEGQTLLIADRDGILYKVGRRDTLQSISIKFKISKENIRLANDLSSEKLFPAQNLFLPDVSLPKKEIDKLYENYLTFPLPGIIKTFYGTSRNSLTMLEQNNDGIEITTIKDQDVLAAADGVVQASGFHPSYGYYVILAHANDIQTFYGYLAGLYYKKGTRVTRGQKIGQVGNSGLSNGSRLHFSVFKNGKDVDPLLYLK